MTKRDFDERNPHGFRDYKEYIAEKKMKWVGKKVKYKNAEYTVVDVDYNGLLLIDLESSHNTTTAIDVYMLDK